MGDGLRIALPGSCLKHTLHNVQKLRDVVISDWVDDDSGSSSSVGKG